MGKNVAVIGAGFVGLPTAVNLAMAGNTVRVIEKDEKRVAMLREGKVPFYEPNLNEALKKVMGKNLILMDCNPTRGSIYSAVDDSEVIIICVPTPTRADGQQELSYIADVFETLSGYDLKGKTIVVKSTVLPGTTDALADALVVGTGKTDFKVAMCPEFLREGDALMDAMFPERIVIGTDDLATGEMLAELFLGKLRESKNKPPVFLLDRKGAEMVKYLSNAFLAVRIAFVNEMANLCRKIGIDACDVLPVVGADARIGPHFLLPSAGYGGDCFPKDVQALDRYAMSVGCCSLILSSADMSNDMQPVEVIDILEGRLGSLKGKNVAIIGLSFKANTSDTRQSKAEEIRHLLRVHGANVRAFDPRVPESYMKGIGRVYEPEEALKDADAAIIQTDADWNAMPYALMRQVFIVDARRRGRGPRMKLSGIHTGIGLPEVKL